MIHMRHEQSCAYAADAYARASGRPGRALGHRRLRPHQRGDRPLRRGADRQSRGLHRRPASDDRGRARLVPGGVRRRDLPHLLQVHQARARLVDDRGRRAHGVPRGDGAAAGSCASSRSRPTSSTSRTTSRGSAAARRIYPPAMLRSAGDPAAIERALDAAGRRRAAADRRRRRRLLVRRRGRAARARDPPADSRLHPPRRAGRRAGGRSAGRPRRVEESRSPAAPTWSSPSASGSGAASTSASRPPGTATRPYIQVDAAPSRIGWHVPAEVPIVGDPKLVLAAARPARGRARRRRHAPRRRAVAGRGRRGARTVRRRAGRAGGGACAARCRSIPPAGPGAHRADEPGRHDRGRQLHALGLALAVARRALPRPDRRRRAAGAGRPRHRHGHRRAARAPGQAGRRRDRRRRPRHRRHGDRDRAQAQAADRHAAVEQQLVGSQLRADADAPRPHRSLRHAARASLRPHVRGDRLPRRARHAARRDPPGAGARVRGRPPVAGQRDRRPAHRPRPPRRQSARLDEDLQLRTRARTGTPSRVARDSSARPAWSPSVSTASTCAGSRKSTDGFAPRASSACHTRVPRSRSSAVESMRPRNPRRSTRT